MILYLLVLALVAPIVSSLNTTKTMTSQLHELQLNNSAGVMSALDMLPKECTKNGKKYQAGESFEIGSLRYKCQKYGVYSIEGCKRGDGTEMKLGESVVVDMKAGDSAVKIKYQCYGAGSSVFYKETACGTMGLIECDKVPFPKGFEDSMKKNGGKTETQGKTTVDGVNLPKGWSLVDSGRKPITGTNASVVTQILMFKPIETRVKRAGFKGSVVGVESMPADLVGTPLSSKGASSSLSSPSSSSSSSSSLSPANSKVIGTQTVGATLQTIKKGDKQDSDLVDLNQRNDQKMEGSDRMKAGTVRGSKSRIDWKGRKVIVNGKTVGTGEGTFAFGNKPTM